MNSTTRSNQLLVILILLIVIASIFVWSHLSFEKLPNTFSQVNDQQTAQVVSALNNGLIGYWRFDEGTGIITKDSSGNSNSGTLKDFSNDDLKWVTGRIGKAISFDGHGYFETDKFISGSGLTEMSFSFWVKGTSASLAGSSIISWAYGNRGCKISDATQKISCITNGTNKGAAVSSASINDGDWHHIVLNSNSNSQTIYIDGVISGNGSEPLSTNSGLIRIGASSNTTVNNFFSGMIDDVRIYNRQLSSAEIIDLANGIETEDNLTSDSNNSSVVSTTPSSDSNSTSVKNEEPSSLQEESTVVTPVIPSSVLKATKNVPSLFRDQFETGDLYSWSTFASGPGGTVSVVTSPVRSGSYSFASSLSNSSSPKKADISKAFTPSGTTYFRFAFYLPDDLTVPLNSSLMFAFPAKVGVGITYGVGIKNKAGNFILTDKFSNEGPVLQRNQWHVIEIAYTPGGSITTYINGLSGLNVAKGSDTIVNDFRFGLSSALAGVSGTVYFDDVTIANTYTGYSPNELFVIHANFFGHLGMKLIGIISGSTDGKTLVASLQGDNGYSSQFYSNSQPQSRQSFDLNLRNLAAGNYTLSVRLVDSSNNILWEEKETFNKPYSGIPKVGIDENNAICLNGKPTFLVTPFNLDNRQINTWANNKYINILYGIGFGKRLASSPVGYGQALEIGASSGLLGGIGPSIFDDNYVKTLRYEGDTNPKLMPTQAVVLSYALALKDNPAHIGYIWYDEPITNSSIKASVVRTWTDWSHESDPQHLVFSNEYGTRGANPISDPWFVALQHSFMYPNNNADVNIFDTYPVEYSNKGFKMADLAQVAEWYRTWNYDLVPFMAFVETSDAHPTYVPNTPAPTPEQVKMLTWINIVHGAKGISWYHYQGRVPAENFVAMSEFVNTVNEVGSIILGPNANRTVTDSANSVGNRVDLLVKETDSDIWIFTVRVTELTESSPITVKFNVQGLNNAIAEVYSEARNINVNSGLFEDVFQPNSVHIYKISKNGGVGSSISSNSNTNTTSQQSAGNTSSTNTSSNQTNTNSQPSSITNTSSDKAVNSSISSSRKNVVSGLTTSKVTTEENVTSTRNNIGSQSVGISSSENFSMNNVDLTATTSSDFEISVPTLSWWQFFRQIIVQIINQLYGGIQKFVGQIF